MSLIVDINQVPWKILQLVRARILKNRAKKAVDSGNWSKETLKRVSSLQAGPLSRKRKEEPGFMLQSDKLHYSITIIDEDDNSNQEWQDSDWANWSNKTLFQFQSESNGEQQITDLASRENKMFILLIPNNSINVLAFYPVQWPKLTEASDQNPFGMAILVARGFNVQSSDYYALIEQATGFAWSNVESAYIAVDDSGSMVRDTVAADLDYFRNKLTNAQIPFAEVSMASERWIFPHSEPS
jgi:hypothetical protein